MFEDVFRVKMAIMSLLFLYFYLRKGIRSLLILSLILLAPTILGVLFDKPFRTFDEFVILLTLLICVPFFYFDKTVKKYKSFYQMCDYIDVIVLITFGVVIFYEKIARFLR